MRRKNPQALFPQTDFTYGTLGGGSTLYFANQMISGNVLSGKCNDL